MVHHDNIITHIKDSLLHLFYPHTCAGCGSDLLARDQVICLSCNESLPYTDFFQHHSNPVEKIFWGRIPIASAASLLYFSKQSVMQRLLHQLKYKGNREVGEFLGRRMGKAMIQSNWHSDVNMLIPLPLFYKKEKSRGYNQARVICEGISAETGLPVRTDLIERNGSTETQTHKNRNERWQNIAGRFSLVDEEGLEGKHVMLIDDVLTTGATLEACGSEILKAVNVKLSIATLAYTTL